MCVKDRVIFIDRARTTAERRCDLAHALAHVELGHNERRNHRQERAAVRYAAKMLIDLDPLAEALAAVYPSPAADAAEILGVDVETLAVRLECLHPGEMGTIRRRLRRLAEGEAA